MSPKHPASSDFPPNLTSELVTSHSIQEEFEDPVTTFKAGSTHIVFGQSGSGKTRFIRRLLKYK